MSFSLLASWATTHALNKAAIQALKYGQALGAQQTILRIKRQKKEERQGKNNSSEAAKKLSTFDLH
jgi:hypothetical protein